MGCNYMQCLCLPVDHFLPFLHTGHRPPALLPWTPTFCIRLQPSVGPYWSRIHDCPCSIRAHMCEACCICLIHDDDAYSQSASATIMAALRLLYAVARDGPTPLPGWVKWVKRVDSHHRPRNAVMVVYAFCATLLCAFLPSAVASTSLLSCTTLLIIMPYGLIALLHLTVTPDKFKGSKFYLGRFRRVIYAIAVIFEGCLFAVSAQTLDISQTFSTDDCLPDLSVPLLFPSRRSNIQFCA